MLVNDIDPIRKKIVVKIHNYDKHINFSALKIRQQVLSHAEFEFFWRISDKITTEPLEDFESFKKFFGAEVMFSFFNFLTQKEMLFKGLIDSMEIRNQDGASAGFLVKGHSHTIVMEDLKYNRMHIGRTLQEIVAESLKGQAVGMWEIEDIAPANNQIIASSLQSNEHGWKYICRLAKNYGEWLYWDGTRLQFGRLKDSKMVLVNGIHLKSFGMGSRLVSNKSSYSGYDYEAGALIEGQLEKTDDNFNDSLMNTSLNAQKLQFIRKMDREIPFHSYNSNAQHQSDIDQMNRLDVAGKAAMMVTYSVESHVPVYVGHIVTVKNKAVDHVMIVTKSEITSIGVGNLVCKFEAIPADAKHPPYTNSEKHGKAKAQPAVVLENNDPAGMGRVRVKYFWGKSDNESDWLRVQTVHGGSGKGFYFIPEIGEEVRVCFEGGNPDRGFVSGSNFNGKEISGYSDSGNNVKAIHTRSGTKILLNDSEGSIFIEDPSGNTWLMDGKGNIGVNAPNDISMNAGNDMDITVGNNMTFNVGNKAMLNIMQMMLVNTPLLTQMVSEMFHTQAGKALINSENEIRMESPEMYVAGQKKLFLHSDESAVMNSKGVTEVKGKSGNKLSNTPTKYKKVPIWMDSRCVIKFRPKDNWTGEFGFDWMRLNDTKLKGDASSNVYKTISLDYNKLKGVYQQRVFKKKSGTKTIIVTYFIPWLCLFPKEVTKNGKQVATTFGNTTATLHLTITIENEEPIRIEMDYDKTLFKLDKDLLTPKTKGTHSVELTITCLKEFDVDKDIKAVSVYKNAKGEEEKALAGKIMVVKNKQRYQQKVVIVQVSTNLGNGLREARPVGRKTMLQRFLRQALVEPNFQTLTLNLSLNRNPVTRVVTNLRTNFNNIANATGGNIPNGATDAIQDFLNAELYKKYGTSYQKAYKIYFIDEEAGDGGGGLGLYGRAYGVPSVARSVVVYRSGFSDTTIAHETLHAMGLSHPFHGGTHMFSRSTTDNIMDYSDIEASPAIPVVQTWKWQWPVIYPNVETEK